MKKCSKCKKYKSITEYYISRVEKDGLFDMCKQCCKNNKHGKCNEYTKLWKSGNNDIGYLNKTFFIEYDDLLKNDDALNIDLITEWRYCLNVTHTVNI